MLLVSLLIKCTRYVLQQSQVGEAIPPNKTRIIAKFDFSYYSTLIYQQKKYHFRCFSPPSYFENTDCAKFSAG